VHFVIIENHPHSG